MEENKTDRELIIENLAITKGICLKVDDLKGDMKEIRKNGCMKHSGVDTNIGRLRHDINRVEDELRLHKVNHWKTKAQLFSFAALIVNFIALLILGINSFAG